jgi:hypothetical protein
MLNAAYGISLADETLVEYVAFFCDALSGGAGLFHVIEDVSDVRWLAHSERQQALIADSVKPLRIWPPTEPAASIVDGLMTYAGSLFHACLRVWTGGEVEMFDDHPLIERLEIVPEMFTSKTHFFLRPPARFVCPEAWLRWSSLDSHQ